jgi:nucleoid-associated protein YejK
MPDDELSEQPELSPRGKELFDWLKEARQQGDDITVERLRKQMSDINEHYDRLYRNREDK